VDPNHTIERVLPDRKNYTPNHGRGRTDGAFIQKFEKIKKTNSRKKEANVASNLSKINGQFALAKKDPIQFI